MQTAPDERTEMLKAAIAQCFKAREPVNVANVKAKLPPDFFLDFDTGAPLDDATVFAEIQSSFAHAPQPAPMIETNPEGRKLAPAPVESFPDYLPPSEKIEPVEDVTKSVEPHPPVGDVTTSIEQRPPVEPVPSRDGTPAPVADSPHHVMGTVETTAAPVVEENTARHGASGPGPNPQARLDGARARVGNLLAERPSLINAQRAARAAVADAVRAYQECDPHRQTPAQLSREFIAASNAQRAARARGEAWATPPENKPRGQRAYVDIERAYSQGGDGNQFARSQNKTGNRRGAYSKHSLGMTNRDPSRGNVPAPVAPPRPTIPALAK